MMCGIVDLMIGMGCVLLYVVFVFGFEGMGLGGEGVTEALRRVASAYGSVFG